MSVNAQEPTGSPNGSNTTVLETAFRFASTRGRPAAFFFLAENEPIGTRTVRALGKSIGDRTFDELDLVIQSSGGDIHAAYQLISFLRQRAGKLHACVPLFARSAATLLCVGADTIALDEMAAVGPLDAQIYQGITDGGRPDYKSALNQFKSLERLRGFSLESLRAASEVLWDREVRRTEDILKYGMEFVRVTSEPLLGKIESHKLGDYGQALAIGEEYGRRLLRRLPGLSDARREEVVRRLVHGYPSHEYVIDCQELAELGFTARLFEDKESVAARELANLDSPRLVGLIDHREPPKQELLEEVAELGFSEPAMQHSDAIGPLAGNPWRESVLGKTLPADM